MHFNIILYKVLRLFRCTVSDIMPFSIYLNMPFSRYDIEKIYITYFDFRLQTWLSLTISAAIYMERKIGAIIIHGSVFRIFDDFR